MGPPDRSGGFAFPINACLERVLHPAKAALSLATEIRFDARNRGIGS